MIILMVLNFALMNYCYKGFSIVSSYKEGNEIQGVITPRDNYYEVILNGKKLGLMYFEEKIYRTTYRIL